MTNAVSPDDYIIKIGDGNCTLLKESFAENELRCLPPPVEPHGSKTNGTLLLVKVSTIVREFIRLFPN